MLKTLRILIVDDQKHARQSLKALLATRFQLIDTYEANNGLEAIRCVDEYRPDIVLMDVRMPDLDGIEATRIIKAKFAHTPVILFSMYPEYHAAALSAGAQAFLNKGEAAEHLLEAVQTAIDTPKAET